MQVDRGGRLDRSQQYASAGGAAASRIHDAPAQPNHPVGGGTAWADHACSPGAPGCARPFGTWWHGRSPHQMQEARWPARRRCTSRRLQLAGPFAHASAAAAAVAEERVVPWRLAPKCISGAAAVTFMCTHVQACEGMCKARWHNMVCCLRQGDCRRGIRLQLVIAQPKGPGLAAQKRHGRKRVRWWRGASVWCAFGRTPAGTLACRIQLWGRRSPVPTHTPTHTLTPPWTACASTGSDRSVVHSKAGERVVGLCHALERLRRPLRTALVGVQHHDQLAVAALECCGAAAVEHTEGLGGRVDKCGGWLGR